MSLIETLWILGAMVIGGGAAAFTYWFSPWCAQRCEWYKGVEFGPDEPITPGHFYLANEIYPFPVNWHWVGLVSLSFASLAWFWGDNQVLGWLVALCALGLIIAKIDWDHHWIPEFLSVPFLLVGLLFSPFEQDPYARILGFAASVVTFWMLMLVVGKLKKVDAIAGGDITLSGAVGAWVGAGALPSFFILTSLCYIAYYAIEKRHRESIWVPMGPAIYLAFIVTILLSTQTIE